MLVILASDIGIVTDSTISALQGSCNSWLVVFPTNLYNLVCLLPICSHPAKATSSKLSGSGVIPYKELTN